MLVSNNGQKGKIFPVALFFYLGLRKSDQDLNREQLSEAFIKVDGGFQFWSDSFGQIAMIISCPIILLSARFLDACNSYWTKRLAFPVVKGKERSCV